MSPPVCWSFCSYPSLEWKQNSQAPLMIRVSCRHRKPTMRHKTAFRKILTSRRRLSTVTLSSSGLDSLCSWNRSSIAGGLDSFCLIFGYAPFNYVFNWRKKKKHFGKVKAEQVSRITWWMYPPPPFQERTVWVWAIGQCLKVIECTIAASNAESFSP